MARERKRKREEEGDDGDDEKDRSLRDPKVAFLVRTHKPSASAIERVCTWATEILKSSNGKTHVWISIDETNVEARGTHAAICKGLENAKLKPGVDVRFHQYREEDMTREYPVLDEEMRKDEKISTVKELHQSRYSLAWGFHNEAINLWFQSLPQKYDFVWVFEDDVGFAGNISDFLKHYESETETDFLADHFHQVSPSWFWTKTVSRSYGAAIPVRKRFHAREHVQRLSLRFLDELHSLAKTKAFTAWSEQSTPSICEYLGFHWNQIDRGLVGKPFSWDGRVSRQEWEKMLAAKSPRPKNKLYHALKF